MRGRWLILLGLTVLSVGCSDFFLFADSEREMTLTGTVTDASSGAVMEGVLVSLEWTPNDTASHSASEHIDVSTSATGEYLIETRLKEVVCRTLFLFFAEPGYKATRRYPDCKGGTQVFDVTLQPD